MSARAGLTLGGILLMGLVMAGAGGCDRPSAVAVVPLVRASELPAPKTTTAPTTAVGPTAIPVASAAPEAGEKKEPLWACDIHREPADELVIYKRREDRKWKTIRVSAGPGKPPGPDHFKALLRKNLMHACAFVGADHAWVVGYGRGIQVYHTTNGGQTWKVTKIEDPDDPYLGYPPHIELRFRDALHGKLVRVQGGGMGHTGVEELRTFTTSDGGQTWRFRGPSCRLHGKPYVCDQ